ncbi:hypothetical protein HPB47_018591 [Ixodes persulcatus]|uniref:Uncharacterized protein n=1 Tax=Ixodes persulcatus TaxID=34615 RepID=A0AC60QKB5_IXOPE|nr:hypothetical protein HPB47_018591 [Ixodes persulcatus]
MDIEASSVKRRHEDVVEASQKRRLRQLERQWSVNLAKKPVLNKPRSLSPQRSDRLSQLMLCERSTLYDERIHMGADESKESVSPETLVTPTPLVPSSLITLTRPDPVQSQPASSSLDMEFETDEESTEYTTVMYKKRRHSSDSVVLKTDVQPPDHPGGLTVILTPINPQESLMKLKMKVSDLLELHYSECILLIKKQWQNLKSRSRAELTLSKKADSTTGAGRNDYRLTPLAEAVLAVIGSTSPNFLGIEGGMDTDQASTAPVGLQPTTNEVVGEDQVLSYKVDVDPGVAFLEVLESGDTQDYEPPDWPLDEDEAPVEPGTAAALLRREGPPPVAGGPPEAAAAAEGRPAPLGRGRRDHLVHDRSGGPEHRPQARQPAHGLWTINTTKKSWRSNRRT